MSRTMSENVVQGVRGVPRRGRAVAVAVMLAGLAGSAVMRDAAVRAGAAKAEAQIASGGGNLGGRSVGQLDSYAMGLLLGGLRGPLVMFLWPSAEEQKATRNLEDFDTKVEWIRLLQPEFDSVHIFQIWNKAYNISAQMASLSNKYATILDGLDYGDRVDRERPNNINILTSAAQVWFDKLGNSSEKEYYRELVRRQSILRAGVGGASGASAEVGVARDAGGRASIAPLVDERGNLLPAATAPRFARPAGYGADRPWVDGSRAQFLEPLGPFPYGVSPFAMAYSLHKRAQVLQTENKQRHLQLSDLVIDSRPALALKNWAEEERELGRRAELTAFGVPVPPDRLDTELADAELTLDATPRDLAELDKAVFCYRKAALLVTAARAEYERHIVNFTNNRATYQSHMDSLAGMAAVLLGDADYLKAIMAKGADRAALVASARAHYLDAQDLNALVLLRYYVDDDLVQQLYPAGVNRFNIRRDSVASGQLLPLAARVRATSRQRGNDPFAEDAEEYERILDRASVRLARLPK